MVHTPARSLPPLLSSRSGRRALAAAWALCCLAFLVLGSLEIKGVLWFVLFAVTLLADGLLFAATHRVADRPTSTLDERERAIRNRAYHAAYLLVFYGLLVVVGGAMLLFFTGNEIATRWFSHPTDHPAALTGFGVATLQLVALLPTALVAWMEGDEPDDLD